MDNIVNGKLVIENTECFFETLKQHISEDAKNKLKLVQEKDINLKKLLYLIISILILHFSLELIDSTGIFITIVSFVYLFLIFYTIFYIIHTNSNDIKRTNNGEELNKKVEGLKNYLRDYSLLSERDSKELELWDEYLIYSVMFGQNKKIVEEFEKYIKM